MFPKTKPQLTLIVGFTILFLIIFRSWFLHSEIIGGDWPYFFNETLQQFPLFPPSWSSLHGNGLGDVIPGYFLDQYLYFTVALFTNTLGTPWAITYKIFWFGLFIALSLFSSAYLIKTVFNKPGMFRTWIGILIYVTNTYILMIVGGGQMGVALAYSIAPLVLASFIKVTDVILSSSRNIKYHPFDKLRANIKYAIIAGLILAAQVMFDPRIAYLSIIAIMLYLVLSIRYEVLKRNTLNTCYFVLYTLVVPIALAGLLNSYWLLPLLFTGQSSLPAGYTSVGGFQFFSFANFSHAISLLHPNWPENIFGKTYFLKSEFLILPIIAFSSLLFTKNKTILFFSLLGLLGMFLAKGANPPFGEINQWLFQYVPGMNMFRDPTKFYLLIALSYSILIPLSISSFQTWLKSKIKYQKVNIHIKNQIFNFPFVFLIFTISYLLFLIRPALLGQLGGTLKQHDVPKEYVELKDFLNNQPDFFRTLWVPRQQRFTFVSNTHPAIEAMPLFEATNSAQIVFRLQESESERLLEKLSVKYVIVPYDSLGEIFFKDRKYDEKQRIDLEKQLDNIVWLKKINTGKITIYETQSYQNHFWLDRGENISYRMINPTRYLVEISTSISDSLTFSENYSPYWTARIGEKYVTSNKTKDGLNSFVLNKVGKYNVEVFYAQEKYFYYGRLVSLSTVIVLVILLIGIRRNFIFKN